MQDAGDFIYSQLMLSEYNLILNAYRLISLFKWITLLNDPAFYMAKYLCDFNTK